MRWKKNLGIAASLVLTTAIVGPAIYVVTKPIVFSKLDTYLLSFNKEEKNKNKYLLELKEKLKEVLDEYKKQNSNFEKLDLRFTNLNSIQSTGETDFFTNLNRTMTTLNENLSFNNIPRTPQSVQDGFYQKNTELMSFYWSPDYNGVGTWLKYMFSDNFSMANYWPPLYALMESPDSPEWAKSLKSFFLKKNKENYLSHLEILQKAATDAGSTVDSLYVNIANTIGVWTTSNSVIDANKSVTRENLATKVGYGIELVNWIASSNPNIPFVEDGPSSGVPTLVRNGYFNPINPNTDLNYRDWFYDSNKVPSRFRNWNKSSPFKSNKTPLNPAFSNAPSASFFSSTWTGLTSWTTISDNNLASKYPDGKFPQNLGKEETPDGTFKSTMADKLVPVGSKTSFVDLENEFNLSQQMTFKIRPIPWVNNKGEHVKDSNNKLTYLSPQDFRASIKAFINSTLIKLNSNEYFLDLLGIDVDATLNAPENNLRNESLTDEKEFIIKFKDPTLTYIDCLDILQKQYFNAIPAFIPSVQNIVDDNLFKKILIDSGSLVDNKININNLPLEKFYGCGDWKKNWQEIISAGSYYISEITDQTIIFKINKLYFDQFKKESSENKDYVSFQMENSEYNNFKKLEQVNLKYSGSYSELITYEQFKTNELDTTELLSAKILESIELFPDDGYNLKTFKINKSNIIGYNLQIYEKDNNNIIVDTAGVPMVDSKTNIPTYKLDKYGNYIWPDGKNPRRKSKVSKEYEDLIVSDYYDPNGKSALIRKTINSSINWISLKSLVFPGISKSIQYSFMPFGVYQLKNTGDAGDFNYWKYASQKLDMTKEQLKDENFYTDFNKRLSGLLIWSYDELKKQMLNNK